MLTYEKMGKPSGNLSFEDDWIVRSNQEAGNGFSDIMILIDNSDTGISIEVKYDENFINNEYLPKLQKLSECLKKGVFPNANNTE